MPEDPTKQEVHVTELAGPDDRWVSVTDASRIARRQEHTVRTWIAQGRLAVNPVRVGINKKTRQVRLSDLAKLTPIIDPDAGIATDLGTLDLPSIPKQQQQVMEQMAALQQEVTGELANLGGQLHDLAGSLEQLAEQTRQTWQVHQQQYQQLAHRDDEQQQRIQQVQDTLVENLHSVDQAWKLAQQAQRDLVAQTEDALRQEMAGLVARIEQACQESAEAGENLRKYVAGLEERILSGMEERRQAHEELAATVTHLHAHTDQQFSQVGNRLEQLEATTGQQQDEIQQQAGRVGQLETKLLTQIGQLATQLAGEESTWQERAIAAEQEARQLRRDLDAQGRLQQALQKQLNEERKAREELAYRCDSDEKISRTIELQTSSLPCPRTSLISVSTSNSVLSHFYT